MSWERMQWEKASSWELGDWEFADLLALGEPLEPVDNGLPLLLHAAASRARPSVAVMVAAVRACHGRARRGRRVTPLLWFIMPSQAVKSRRPAAGA